MIRRVMFRWSENLRVKDRSARRLNVEDDDGRRLVTFGELDALLGEQECRRLVRVAIRRGTSRWHPANAPAVLALAREMAAA